MQRLVFFILSFFYVVGLVPNSALGLFADLMPVTCVLLIVGGLFLPRPPMPVGIRPLALGFWLFAVYVFTISTILYSSSPHASGDVMTMTHFVKPVRMLLTFYGGVVLFSLYVGRYGEDYKVHLFKDIVICLSINSMIVIMQGFIPAFNDILQRVLYISITDVHIQVWDRPGGLLYSGGAMPSVIAGLALPFLAYLYSAGRINIVTQVALFVVASVAIIMSGRTGLLFVMLYFVLLVTMFGRKNWLRGVFQMGLVLFLLGTVYIGYGFLREASLDTGSKMFENSMERLMRLLEPGSFQTGAAYQTYNYLFSTFRLPSDSTQLLLGDIGWSIYNYTGALRITDMGYNRSIWLYGFIGSAIYYFPFAVLIKDSLRHKWLGKARVFYLVFFLAYLIVELKENAVYSRNLFNVAILLALSLYTDISTGQAAETFVVQGEDGELIEMLCVDSYDAWRQ